uniref:Uncharacterized protein n=1 Tax=Leersia perrieri TaxID=77586 RepID=A0A0D9V2G9_9ORYZ
MAASLKVYLMLFTAFFLSGLMQLSMAQGAATAKTAAAAPARVIDAKAIDQAIAYLLMFAALFLIKMAPLKLNACVLLSTVFLFSGLIQLSMAQGSPAATSTARVDVKAVDQAVAYLLMLAALFVTYLAH